MAADARDAVRRLPEVRRRQRRARGPLHRRRRSTPRSARGEGFARRVPRRDRRATWTRCASCSSARRCSPARRASARRCWPAGRPAEAVAALRVADLPDGAGGRALPRAARARSACRTTPTRRRSSPATARRSPPTSCRCGCAARASCGLSLESQRRHLPLAAARPPRRPDRPRRWRHERRAPARLPRAAQARADRRARGHRAARRDRARSARAGLCRTDLHIQEGQWAEKSGVELPYTPGHENAGWVHEIGSGVTNVEVGDTVIVHPLITCGLCRPAAPATTALRRTARSRASPRRRLRRAAKTTARSVVKLDPSLEPEGHRRAGRRRADRLSTRSRRRSRCSAPARARSSSAPAASATSASSA